MNSSRTEFEYGSCNVSSRHVIITSQKLRNAVRSVMLAGLALFSAGTMIMSLLIRAETTRQSDIQTRLSEELAELCEQNERLIIEYEFAQDLGELEEYAKNELGMQSAARIYKGSIDTETEDKAQIIKEG